MIYTDLTKKAMKLAYEAHKNQKDNSGMPYIFHPFHVAEQMTDELTTAAALLHDVVEDTEITFEQLKELGFSEDLLVPLRLLTKKKGEDYMEYIKRISTNEIAIKVKLADLEHNSDISRYNEGEYGEYEQQRQKKYKKAMQILRG